MLLLQINNSYSSWPPPPTPWGFWDYVRATSITFFIVWFLSIIVRPKKAQHQWHHHFADLQFSPKTVYNKIEAEIKRRQLPKVTFSRHKFFEAGLLSSRREFLCISYSKFTLDVCCAQYGPGYYMSWWGATKDPGPLSRIPILNNLFGVNPNYQSYYQLDAAMMFQSAVHDAILTVIDDITLEKGIRLTELERQPTQWK